MWWTFNRDHLDCYYKFCALYVSRMYIFMNTSYCDMSNWPPLIITKLISEWVIRLMQEIGWVVAFHFATILWRWILYYVQKSADLSWLTVTWLYEVKPLCTHGATFFRSLYGGFFWWRITLRKFCRRLKYKSCFIINWEVWLRFSIESKSFLTRKKADLSRNQWKDSNFLGMIGFE